MLLKCNLAVRELSATVCDQQAKNVVVLLALKGILAYLFQLFL
jgi:hypothetical protein